MAIGTPTQHFAARVLFNGQNQAINPTSNITSGGTAILFVNAGGGESVASVTDSKGNTWTVDHTYAATLGLAVASASVVTTIATTDTITINYAASKNLNRDIYLVRVTGLSAAPFDKGADAEGGVSGSFSVGPTATLSQADEIAFLFVCDLATGRVATVPGWLSTTTPDFSIGHLRYLIVASTSAITASGTWDSAAQWVGTVATYKGFTAPPKPTGGTKLSRLQIVEEGQTIVLGGR